MMIYSAYGMNTNLEQMHARCKDACLIGVGQLDNYTLKFRQHADIEPASGQHMQVLVWDISPQDLDCLDRFEGYPHYYLRRIVPVLVQGVLLQSIIYQMSHNRTESPPTHYYLDLCSLGYKHNNMPLEQLDHAYFSSLVK